MPFRLYVNHLTIAVSDFVNFSWVMWCLLILLRYSESPNASLFVVLTRKWLRTFFFSCTCIGFSRVIYCVVVTIPGEENLYVDMMTYPSETADLPISPLVTANEADMSAAMGREELQLPDEISLKGPPAASAGPKNTRRCTCKQKKVTSDDVLRLQYETLQCKKETLLLKKAKLELQIKLLEKQL